MKKPIVAFDTGANGDTVKDGENGFLVKYKNLEIFSDRLLTLIKNDSLRNKMGKNGFYWSKRNLDFDVIAKNFYYHIANKIN